MALTAARNTRREGGVVCNATQQRIVRNTVQVYQGGMVCADANGHLVPAGNANATSQVLGRVEESVLGDGTLTAHVTAGCFWYDNSGASIAVGNLYQACYAVDDEAVALGDNFGARLRAGIIVDVDATLGVCVLSTPYLSSTGQNDLIQRRAVTITSADLTTAGVGPETENIGAVLPNLGCIILGYRIRLNDAFDNGAGVSLALEVGDSDVDSIEDGFDLYTGSTKEGVGFSYTTPGPGLGTCVLNTQLRATITAGADQLANFTNGDVDIEILFINPTDFF